MNILPPLKSEHGFTIQELLVAMIAGSLLVGFGFSLYLFVAKIVQKDLHGREHRKHALQVVERMASDVEQSSRIVQVTDSTLELESAGRGAIDYTISRGELRRRGVAVGPLPDERWLLAFASPSPGMVGVTLKSWWGKDSSEVSAEVSVPMSSSLTFRAGRENAVRSTERTRGSEP